MEYRFRLANKPGWVWQPAGETALRAIRNPFHSSGVLMILPDIESLQLSEEVWEVIERTLQQHGLGKDLSDRLKRYVCPYCNTANPPGESRCIACGAPLGDIQPIACLNCVFIVSSLDRIFPNCQNPLPSGS